MKRLGWILMVLMAASPAWAANTITVQELKDLLISLHQVNKTDLEVASALEQVDLSEQMNRVTMNSLGGYIPGPNSTEQMFVLEARSAVLPPPAAELPTAPAPDAATQTAILDKAANYVTRDYEQLPLLTATKNTFRFQNNLTPPPATPDKHSAAASSAPGPLGAGQIIHFIGSTESPVETDNGAEKNSAAKEKDQHVQSHEVNLLGQSPVLSSIFQEAQAAGKLNWLRWEQVNGIQAAVFSFAVDKKKSRYAVNDCCFSDAEEGTGLMSYGNYGSRAGVSSDPTTSMPALGSMSATMPTGMQRIAHTEWRNFKETVPYHGELFVDPATGVVLRLVIEPEFRSSDLINQENQRIDYGQTTVGGKTLILPVKNFIDTVVVPNGYGGYGKHSTRHILLTIDYTNYAPAGSTPMQHK
jgi:hypothetical protein